VLKQGGVIQAYPDLREKRCAGGFPFARHVFHPFCSSTIQGALDVVDISKTKVDTDHPGI
jgi:hypothetical protein